MNFHETAMGHQFFQGQLPSLIKSLNRVADAIETEAKNEAPANTYDVTGLRLARVAHNTERAEQFMDEVLLHITNNQDSVSAMGVKVAQALRMNDASELLLALTGTTADQLLNLAEHRVEFPVYPLGKNFFVSNREYNLWSLVGCNKYNDIIQINWTFIGEGYSGDYDPDDPEDEQLLRFDVYINNSDEPAESRCTRFPLSASAEQQKAALDKIFCQIADNLDLLSHNCDVMSYIYLPE